MTHFLLCQIIVELLALFLHILEDKSDHANDCNHEASERHCAKVIKLRKEVSWKWRLCTVAFQRAEPRTQPGIRDLSLAQYHSANTPASTSSPKAVKKKVPQRSPKMLMNLEEHVRISRKDHLHPRVVGVLRILHELALCRWTH